MKFLQTLKLLWGKHKTEIMMILGSLSLLIMFLMSLTTNTKILQVLLSQSFEAIIYVIAIYYFYSLNNKIKCLIEINKELKENIEKINDSIKLKNIIETGKDYVISSIEKERQRKSFVFGNTKLSNPNITEELVNE